MGRVVGAMLERDLAQEVIEGRQTGGSVLGRWKVV